MSGVSLYDLYKAPVSLWVEDELTRAVLSEFWMDRDIALYVGQSKEGVKNFVASVPKRELGPIPPKLLEDKVYGLVDCDFEEPDEQHWSKAGKRLFRTPCHEFENSLLHFEILASLSRETAQNIERLAKTRAQELLCWKSCKATLRKIRGSLSTEFPSDPRLPSPGKAEFQSLQEAVNHITRDTFLSRQVSAFQRWTISEISDALQENYNRWQADLTSSDWLNTFSGKELFRYLRGTVKGLDPLRSQQPDLDLAKSIARKMRETQQIPAALVTLRQTIRQKANLPQRP
jgi:hypothetical protein